MVYVDDMEAPFGRMIMCHMIADSTQELLDMCDKIGVRRIWIQDAGTPHEHFDISKTMRIRAVRYGAKVITQRELGMMVMRRYVVKRGEAETLIPEKILYESMEVEIRRSDEH